MDILNTWMLRREPVADVLGTVSPPGRAGLPAGVAERGGVKPALPVIGRPDVHTAAPALKRPG